MAGLSTEHEIVLELWREISAEWRFASAPIAAAFKRHKLIDDQKKEIVETLHGMIAQFRTLDFALTSAQRSKRRAGARALLGAWLLFAQKISLHQALSFGRDLDWKWVASVSERIEAIADPMERFAVKFSLPNDFATAIAEQYGKEAKALAAALNTRAPATIRVNTLKSTRDELQRLLEEEGIYATLAGLAPFALIVENPSRLFASKAFQDGLFEAQDEGSQLIAELTAPARGSQVLDACAGSGGKTLALSALMGARGVIQALDVSDAKLRELRRRARRARAHNIRAERTAANEWPQSVHKKSGQWQRVLVDAPCSGSGTLRRNPELRWRNTLMDLATLNKTQLDLARRAVQVCANGGRVVYATCSVLREENERVVETLLADGICECIPIKEVLTKARAASIASPCGRFLKLFPHIHGTDVFFAAVLRKRAGG